MKRPESSPPEAPKNDTSPATSDKPTGFPAADPFQPFQKEDDLAREGGTERRKDPRRNTGQLADPAFSERAGRTPKP